MNRPDFACDDLSRLPSGDLRFLLEQMPRAGHGYREIAGAVEQMPDTLESMLTSDYVFQLIRDRQRTILELSPFLVFGVLLRRSLGAPRSRIERRVVNYLANLLTLFVRTDRVFRVAPDATQWRAYVVDLIRDLTESDPRKEFLTCAHIGNYSLWLTGLQSGWLEHRHRYHRRAVNQETYADYGRAYYDRASRHRMARELRLDDVFLRLATHFDHYRRGLQHMQRELPIMNG